MQSLAPMSFCRLAWVTFERGGTLRVSQTQLLQPFFAILFAVPLLGEPLEPRWP